MRIVIPISKHDVELSVTFSETLINHEIKLNFPRKHDLLIVSNPQNKILAKNFFDKIKMLFKESDLYIIDGNGPEGWPLGPNFYWKKTIEYLIGTNNKLPWFWMELDCTPLKENWMDLLEEEYKKTRKPFVGHVEDSTLVTSKTKKLIKVGEHLAGTAIYPANINKWCKNWRYVDEISKAFDVVCSSEIVKNSFSSPLFIHGFRTRNYKIVDKIITCSDNAYYESGKSYALPITQEAVIHHGCQDGSLAQLISKGLLQTALINTQDLPKKEKIPTRQCFEVNCPDTFYMLSEEELLENIDTKGFSVSEIFIEGLFGLVEGPSWKLEPLNMHEDNQYYYTVILENRIFVSGFIKLIKTYIINPEEV